MTSYKRKLIFPILGAAVFTFIGLRLLNHKRLARQVALNTNLAAEYSQIRAAIKPSYGYDNSWRNQGKSSNVRFSRDSHRKAADSQDYANSWKFHRAFHKEQHTKVITQRNHRNGSDGRISDFHTTQHLPQGRFIDDLFKQQKDHIANDNYPAHLKEEKFRHQNMLESYQVGSEIQQRGKRTLSNSEFPVVNGQHSETPLRNVESNASQNFQKGGWPLSVNSVTAQRNLTKSFGGLRGNRGRAVEGQSESKLWESLRRSDQVTRTNRMVENDGMITVKDSSPTKTPSAHTENVNSQNANNTLHLTGSVHRERNKPANSMRNHLVQAEDPSVRPGNMTQSHDRHVIENAGKLKGLTSGTHQLQTLPDSWKQREKAKQHAKPSGSHSAPNLQDIWDRSHLNTGRKERNSDHHHVIRKGNQGQSEKLNLWKEKVADVRDKVPISNPSEKTFRYDPGRSQVPPESYRSKVMGFRFQPELGRKYAVFSVAVQGDDFNYAFPAPINVKAWRKVGYDCIVLLVGTEQAWVSSPVLYYIIKELRRADPIVLFLDSLPSNRVTISQISRLFVSNLFDWRGLEDTYVLTTDADIWPLRPGPYELPKDKLVVSLNAECCGSFRHRGQMYTMRPMCNIGMSVKMWREVVGPMTNGTWPFHVSQMIDHFQEVFGDVVRQPVVKGENEGWFLDQHMISVKLDRWARMSGRGSSILFLPRDTGKDRVDRSAWSPHQVMGRNDVHLLEHLYQPGVWERVKPVMLHLFSNREFTELEEYRNGFIRMLLNYRTKQS